MTRPGEGQARLGADIGGTAIKCGRLDADGRVVAEQEVGTPAREGLAPLVDALLGALATLFAPGESWDTFRIGVGCAGLIDPRRGVVVSSPNLPGLRRAPLRDAIRERTGIAAALLNDANAFVLAEARLGAGRGMRSVIGLTLGTGVGGGLVFDGELWEGEQGFAGEPGHAPLSLDGPLCVCGRRGCLEALLSARAVSSRYATLAGVAEAGLTPAEISRRASTGDAHALAAWSETGRILGQAMLGLSHLLDPACFVIGGGQSRAASYFLPRAEEELRTQLLWSDERVPLVRAAELGPSAGWIGAALAGPGAGSDRA